MILQEITTVFREKFSMRWLSAIGTSLAGVAILIVYSTAGPKATDFALAETLFEKWKLAADDSALFEKMSQALRKVPTLQKKYEPVIAQKLMGGGKGAEALHIAYRAIEQAKSSIPYHAHFAETSLLIEKGQYQQALLAAVHLKEEMLKAYEEKEFWNESPRGGSLLFAHNLLRIACLQQELKNKPGELAAWNELEEKLLKHNKSPTTELLLSSFQEKRLDLTHYIAMRKSILKEEVHGT